MNEETCSTSLLDLPCEDITFPHIFDRLAPVDLINLRQADQRFHSLVDCYLGRKIKNLDVWGSCMDQKQLEQYSEALSDLRYFSIAYAPGISDGPWSQIFKRSPNLKHLDLTRSTVSGYTLQIAITNCTNITCLHLSSCFWVDDGCMEVIGLHTKHLECFDISGTNVTEKMSILMVCRSNTSLKRIDLSRLDVVDKNLLKGISSMCRQIVDIRLRFCSQITKHILKWVSRHILKGKKRCLKEAFDDLFWANEHKDPLFRMKKDMSIKASCPCCPPVLTDIRHGQYITAAKAKELRTVSRDAPPCSNYYLSAPWDLEGDEEWEAETDHRYY